MKTVTATFPTSDSAKAAVEALHDAGVEQANVTVEAMDNGDTVVTAIVDDGQMDAAAAILKTGVSANVEDHPEPVQPGVEGHPDGSGPVVPPILPIR